MREYLRVRANIYDYRPRLRSKRTAGNTANHTLGQRSMKMMKKF